MIPTYIVDDVESDRYIARRRLSKTGLFGPVQEAPGGSEFLDLYFAGTDAEAPPPLILMDINMPELSGFETLEALRLRLAGDPGTGARNQVVAVFSSSDNERDIERSSALGIVQHFFTKPLDDAAIAEILETYRASGAL
ncbi:response regulator [Pseudooceanicola sp. CBS1P-1]|uniref:Response regulator n=1 Tax=Pseudooceanicola albus TaxID=2692189 RepID=A0A6L7G2V0_9RHOB|nr:MULTISPECIES: response regulator [Pseudooceanicola]MBT9382361.1 response regulator [Pseudooceanicola endophyticus]MXN16903.1 response regulator [Pseudooceanicola albus]